MRRRTSIRRVGGSQPWRRRDRERGSLAVVVAILAVAALFATALVTGVVGDMATVDHNADLQAAQALDQAGLSDALFRIDQIQGTPASFCVGPSSQCSVSAIPGAPGVEYTAIPNPAATDTITVRVLASVHGLQRAISAQVQRVTDYPSVVFGGSSVTINGTTTSIDTVDATGAFTGTTPSIGTDGQVACHGSGSSAYRQIIYGSGTNEHCSNPVDSPSTYDPQPPAATCPSPLSSSGLPTPCMPAGPSACPGTESAGTWTIGSSSSPVTLEPGVYECVGNLTMTGTIGVDGGSSANQGQVQLYVFPPQGSSTADLDVSQAVLNASGSSAGTIGDPANLQIFVGGSGQAELASSSSTGQADAVLYAPGLAATVDGGKVNWTGALVVNTFTDNGGPNTVLHAYQGLSKQLSSWQMGDFTQTSPADFSLSLG